MATVHPSRMSLVPKDSRDAYPDYSDRDRRRARSRSPRDRRDRSRSRDRDTRYLNSDSKRRASPAYDDYKRHSPPRSPPRGESNAPWRQQQNMYPNRREHGERDKPLHVG